jgi:hypothetical protein
MTDTDLREQAVALVRAAAEQGITTRLLGGLAIALHSPSALRAPFAREYEDIDLMIEKKQRGKMDQIAERCGFAADQEFNNINGAERRAYYRGDGVKLDVFVGEFCMCHTLGFDGRMQLDDPTIALSDLLLTKAQIFELNRKDAFDLLALLADHGVADGDADTIDAGRVAQVTGNDWGIWRTVGRTLDTIEAIAREEAELAPWRDRIVERIAALGEVMERAPKSTKWKMRAKVGDRKVWYALPEDPERHPAAA